jgi:hypothetical protein
MPADSTASSLFVVTASLTPENSVTQPLDAPLLALFCAAMESSTLEKSVITVFSTTTLFPTLAEPIVDFTLAVTPFAIPTKTATPVQLTLLNARTAELNVEMLLSILESSAITESLTMTPFPTLAEPTVYLTIAATVLLITLRSATTALATAMLPTPAEFGASFLVVETESSIPCTVNNVTVVPVAVLTATSSAEMEDSMLVNFVTTESETLTSILLAAERTAAFLDAVTVLLILMKNAITELETAIPPILVALIAPFPSVVMVLLITCLVKCATKESETPSLPSMDVLQNVLSIFAANQFG